MRTLAFLFFVGLVSSAAASFKCVDAQGKTHFGDSPPPACENAVTFELSPSGSVVRRIDPSSAAGAAVAATERQATEKLAAAKRADRALLDSYTSVQEIDRARDRSVEMTRGRLEATNLRLQQVAKREKELQRALPAKGRPVPAQLQADIDAARAESASLAAIKTRLEKDFEETQRRYDTDRSRWLELRASR